MDERGAVGGGSSRTYSELRLDEIATSTRQIAFWVRLWSILAATIFGLGVALSLLAAIAGSLSSLSLPTGPNAVVYVVLGGVAVLVFGAVAGLLYWGTKGGPTKARPAEGRPG